MTQQEQFLEESYTPDALAFALQAANKSPDAFCAEVIAGVRSLMETHRLKINGALVHVAEGRVITAIGTRSEQYDFDIDDPIAETIMSLFRKGWEKFDMIHFPDNPTADRLLHFANFALHDDD